MEPRVLLLLLFAGVTGCKAPYHIRENLSYDSAIGYAGTFDVYEPRSNSVRANRPAILAIHGGAWRGFASILTDVMGHGPPCGTRSPLRD